MTPYWYIQNDFLEKRSRRVGASDIPALIPNPERPNESLAGYERTAVTIWEEKTGRKERDPAGLPAEMGHWNEVKAIELFIRGINPDMAREYRRSRLEYERLSEQFPETRAEDYQTTPFRHNAQWYNDDFIVHPDGVYEPGKESAGTILWGLTSPVGNCKCNGKITIDLSKPFLLEAKNHGFFATKRRAGSVVNGYDFELKTWQGVPLREYVQCQFQMACLDVDVNYLPLITDAAFGTFHVWEIKRDRKTGDRLIDLAAKLAYYIHKDIEPKELAMNAADIAEMYPTMADDFAILSGPEADAITTAAIAWKDGDELEKIGKQKKKDATDALAVYLKDTKELRVERDGSIIPVAAWIEKKGAERIIGLKEIRAMDKGAVIEKYLTRKGLVKEGEGSRYVSVKWKED